jgi:metallo-beta-lactamase family protein
VSGQGGAATADKNGDMRILYTGDIGRPQKPIIREPAVNMPPPHYIFLESTYGNRRHEDADMALESLVKAVRRAVELKSKIIIPAFAVERTQEIIYYLHLLVDQKKIPAIPIYVDSPMATNATSIFNVHPECFSEEINRLFTQHYKNPFGFNKLGFVNSVEESKSLNDMKGPMIIIAADGMCEAGRVVHHLANNISNSANTVLIVGYMAENTLGRRLKAGEKEVSIFGDRYAVRAQIDVINAFSAHADYSECLDWLKKIDTSCLKKIFLVHGEVQAQAAFKPYLRDNGFPNVEIVKYGQTYTA